MYGHILLKSTFWHWQGMLVPLDDSGTIFDGLFRREFEIVSFQKSALKTVSKHDSHKFL
jgi:hypothetical protein